MRRIISIVAKNWLLVLILLIGIFLRFYRFGEFVTFLGDQGRDAIIIKRIITLEHFPAIGAPTSVGQVYLGPFYYYFIAPWLLISKMNPIGLAIGVSFFSSFFLLINYFVTKDLFNKKVALTSTALLAFSYRLIDLSRFSWNPNLMPLFVLLTVYFFIKSRESTNKFLFVLWGAFLSFSIQLHYLALFLGPTMAIFIISDLWTLFKNRKKIVKYVLNILIAGFSFFIFSSPILFFDLRHQFLNTKNFISIFTQKGTTGVNIYLSIFNTFSNLNKFSFGFDFNKILSGAILIALIAGLIVLIKTNNKNLKMFFAFLLIFIGLFSFYNGEKFSHYFGVAYPLYYVIIASILTDLTKNKLGKIFLGLFLFGFIILNTKNYPYFSKYSNNQLERAKKIAKIIFNNVNKEKFTVTALPEKYSDSTYRYYLEIWKKPSLEKDSLDKADELFVACEKDCLLMGNPQWDIAYFAPNKIVGTWKVDNVKIYKLIR